MKDFFTEIYQVYLAKAFGADAILIILSAISDSIASQIYDKANDLDLTTIVEVHNEEELHRIENFSSAIIGVNNRNLKTFEVDINNSIKLKKIFKEDNIFISESGIKSKKDIRQLQQHNINVFLIGESLMKGDFFET